LWCAFADARSCLCDAFHYSRNEIRRRCTILLDPRPETGQKNHPNVRQLLGAKLWLLFALLNP